LSKAFW